MGRRNTFYFQFPMSFKLINYSSQKGRTAIVTGANAGIGYEITAGLASLDFKVIMACRNLGKAEKAKAKISRRVPDADLEIMELDLSKLDSVRNFSKEFRSKYDQLDILINNAGVLDYSGRKNEARIEIQFATNHLGHFLLTKLLLEKMPDAAASRIVSMSSIAHKKSRIHFDDLNCENVKHPLAPYGQSKLACLMFGDELHRRLKKANKSILSISVHPGGSDSDLFDAMPRGQYIFFKILSPFITHSNKSAAQSSLYAALESNLNGGEYFGPQGIMDLKGPVGIAKRSGYSKNEEIAGRLWEVSEEMVGEKFKV